MAQPEAVIDSAAPEMSTIYIMGKRYEVPKGLTIMRALEHSGYRLVRGAGCRGGFCGACGTVFRTQGDYRLKVGLACQTVVEEGMHLTQIPFYPANKALYNLEELKPNLATLVQLYPELPRCVGCNTCTKACPQGLDVMDYMAKAMRGDIAKVADISFDCIMCGLCASRCPAEEVQYNVAILARRLYSKYIAPPAGHLVERVREIEDRKYDQELDRMANMSIDELKELYNARDIEP
jgi:formate hydrogenlyase subunit 6/NADH:ubiquinone oxidoreductase subunit I